MSCHSNINMSEDEMDIVSISLACPCSCSCSLLFLALCNHIIRRIYLYLTLSSFLFSHSLPCALFIYSTRGHGYISACLSLLVLVNSFTFSCLSLFLFFCSSHRELLLSLPICLLLLCSSFFAVSGGSVEHVCATCLRKQGDAATEPHISSVRGCWRAHHNGSSCGSHTDRA